jgi:hypothetical protein
MNPGDLDKHDQHDQERIHKLTNELKRILVSTEEIVIAARTIGNSTSDFRNSNYSQFWKEQVCFLQEISNEMSVDVGYASIDV